MTHRYGRTLGLVAFFVAGQAAITPQLQAAGAPSVVIASQGGENVTLEDIDAFAERVPEADRPNFFNSPKRIESMLMNLLLQKQLATAARKTGLDKDPKVARQLELAEIEALSKAEANRFRDELAVPDLSQLVRENYLANKEKYQIPGKLDVRHILIGTESRSEAEAEALAKTVEAEARKDPAKFVALVAQYSDDPSKEANQGLMHDAGSSRYVPEFATAAKALAKPDDISKPIKTKFGFHILQLVAKEPAKPRSFDEVKDEIRAKLSKEYVEKQVSTRMDTIRNQPIDANQELVESLRKRYAIQSPASQETTGAKP